MVGRAIGTYSGTAGATIATLEESSPSWGARSNGSASLFAPDQPTQRSEREQHTKGSNGHVLGIRPDLTCFGLWMENEAAARIKAAQESGLLLSTFRYRPEWAEVFLCATSVV